MMSRRIGKPLTEVVGKPRVLPKTLPMPAPIPEKVPEKEKVPVEVGAPAENVIHRVASFLGVPDAWVATKILDIAGRIELLLDMGALGKKQRIRYRS
jgi:hypothetical protein